MSSLIDRDRSAYLGDVGQSGYMAAVCVSPDGRETLWLVSRAELDSHNPACGSADQPHEKLGKLPASWRRRIHGDPRCGAPTASGRPCRHKVPEQGDQCALHHRCEACGELDHCATGHRPDCPLICKSCGCPGGHYFNCSSPVAQSWRQQCTAEEGRP